MTINYLGNNKYQFLDRNGEEIHENDIVRMNGRNMRVFLTDQDALGTDATNPVWLASRRAEEGEMGIYPFDEYDDPVIVCKGSEYTSFDPVTGNITK